MTRRLLAAAVAATSAAACYASGPTVAMTVLLLAGWLREHALRRGAETRLRAAAIEVEAATEARVVRLHPDDLHAIIWEPEADADLAPDRVLH